MLCVRKATRDDVALLVKIHTRAFNGFVLTMLGEGFLLQLYKGFVELSGGVLFVINDSFEDENGAMLNGRALGFVAGTRNPHWFFAQLRRTRGIKFVVAAFPALIRHPKIVAERLLASFRYQGDSLPELPGYWLLSSLAVEPKATGRGFGSDLIQKFCSAARDEGAAGVYLTTDAHSNEGVRALYARNGFTVRARMTRSNGREMVLYARDFLNDRAE